MKDFRGCSILDGELVSVALGDKQVYGVVFKSTCYYLDENNELRAVNVSSNMLIRLSIPANNEVTVRKNLLRHLSNSDFDSIAVEKASKLSGKKKMEVTPFIQSVTNCVAMNINNKKQYRFKSMDKQSMYYVSTYSKDVANYIGDVTSRKLKVTVTNNELVIEVLD